MEEKIKRFLSGYSYGSGYGDGYGSGSGSGDGDGYGDGSGYGSGSGYGYSYGSGSGDGYGDGSGYGDGYGSGSGYGDGSGYGSGYGSGDGDGYGSGDKIFIQKYKEKDVYYVDGIPCVFVRVHEEWAEVEIISNDDFTTKKAFLAKFENTLAHGESIKEAMTDAMQKYYSSLDFKAVKKKLLNEFAKKKRLTVKELYSWHGVLTGSCRFGRDEFQRAHNLKDEDTLSLEEFVKLTGDAFGGDKVRSLL